MKASKRPPLLMGSVVITMVVICVLYSLEMQERARVEIARNVRLLADLDEDRPVSSCDFVTAFCGDKGRIDSDKVGSIGQVHGMGKEKALRLVLSADLVVVRRSALATSQPASMPTANYGEYDYDYSY